MQYSFDWDPAKAKRNEKKHGVRFERAARVFLDPFAITVFDYDHSAKEDRWITIGMVANEVLIVVVHTFRNVDNSSALIRIISARKATREETQQYHERHL